MNTPDTIRKLADSQVEAFDTEYVQGGRWLEVKALIERDFADGEFTLLDVGGGNGKFADRILEHFPRATVAVLDNSQSLLAKNTESARKTIVCDSVENLESLGKTKKYDIVCLHWLLHHLVSDSYGKTTRNQLAALRAARQLMTPRGRISVFENMYEGYILRTLPGQAIYHLTASSAIAPFVRAMGANTAGVGVCFRSSGEWHRLTEDAGLQIASYAEPDDWVWPQKLAWRIFLHLRSIRVGHMWLAADVSGNHLAP